MKLKNLLQIVGIKGKPKHYLYEVIEYDLGKRGVAKYANWKHPSSSIWPMTTALVDAYQTYIQPGDFCIDIGAHCGDTTLPMGIAAGPSGCVLALEPNPYLYHVLEKNARANRQVANIRSLMAAAGSEEGFMQFEYSDSGFCNGGRHQDISVLSHGHPFNLTVFAVNLEKELRTDYADDLPRLSFIKVDAEGYDLFVLKSMESILREFRPTIKAEVFSKTSRSYRENLLTFLENLGYTVSKIAVEPVGIGERLTRDNLAESAHYDILALPNKL